MYYGINHPIISFPLVSAVIDVFIVVVVIVVVVDDDVVVSLLWYLFGGFATTRNTWLIIMCLL